MHNQTGPACSSSDIIERETIHIEHDHIDHIQATLALKDDAVALKGPFLAGDPYRVAEVIQGGWLAKRQLALRRRTPSIERAFTMAMDNGTLARKVPSAAGGGYIMFPVDLPCRHQPMRALGRCPDGAVERPHRIAKGADSRRFR
jgi:D-glycero-alpha-D-manno-heptose-7-phosphate kinase